MDRRNLSENFMRKAKLVFTLTCVALAFGAIEAQEVVKREPMTFTLDCAGGDCPLLKGMPQTSGMRGGSVKLKTGDSVGWHSTAANEEALVILHGSGSPRSRDIPTYPLAKRCSPISRQRRRTTLRTTEQKYLNTFG